MSYFRVTSGSPLLSSNWFMGSRLMQGLIFLQELPKLARIRPISNSFPVHFRLTTRADYQSIDLAETSAMVFVWARTNILGQRNAHFRFTSGGDNPGVKLTIDLDSTCLETPPYRFSCYLARLGGTFTWPS